eukprot:954933-Amphidinium_carterae.1
MSDRLTELHYSCSHNDRRPSLRSTPNLIARSSTWTSSSRIVSPACTQWHVKHRWALRVTTSQAETLSPLLIMNAWWMPQTLEVLDRRINGCAEKLSTLRIFCVMASHIHTGARSIFKFWHELWSKHKPTLHGITALMTAAGWQRTAEALHQRAIKSLARTLCVEIGLQEYCLLWRQGWQDGKSKHVASEALVWARNLSADDRSNAIDATSLAMAIA